MNSKKNIKNQADNSSISLLHTIYVLRDNLMMVGSSFEATEIGRLDYTNLQFKLSHLLIKAATSYDDNGNSCDIPVECSVLLPIRQRILFCQEAIENLSSCYELRKMVLPRGHRLVREVNEFKLKAWMLLHHLDQFETLHTQKCHLGPCAPAA